MKIKIEELVSEINNREKKELVSCYELGTKWFLKEYSDVREPKLNIFDDSVSCVKYLEYLNKESISKYGEGHKGKPQHIWYKGRYLGLYMNDSFDLACREALKDLGMSSTEIEDIMLIDKDKFENLIDF